MTHVRRSLSSTLKRTDGDDLQGYNNRHFALHLTANQCYYCSKLESMPEQNVPDNDPTTANHAP